MAENDPYFSGRFMVQGTAGAEFIYNEFLGRVMASGFRILSRTTSAPPGSPNTFDSYLVPASTSGDWIGLEGDFVFWFDKWYVVPLQPGMHVFVIDETTWVNFPTTAATAATAVDGDVTLVPQFVTGAWRLEWDAGLGTAAFATLADDTLALTPTNMVAGRRYVLRIQQDGAGGNNLNLQHLGWANDTGSSPPAIDLGADAVSDLHIMGPMAPWSVPTIFQVNAGVQQVSTV